jgi:two-component system response regulator FixJ
MSDPVTIAIVDDDEAVRDALRLLLKLSGYEVETYESARAFLTSGGALRSACLVTDIRMPDMDGIELQYEVKGQSPNLPVIIMTGHGDIPLAVRAMKAGAVDFLEKPFAEEALLDSVRTALSRSSASALKGPAHPVAEKIHQLTSREKQVLDLIVEGNQNKMIAHTLGISVRTVEVYRGRLMEKMDARTVADLVRMTLAAKS